MIVVDGLVPGGAVVPYAQRAGAPADSAGIFRLHAMAIDLVQQGFGFLPGPAVDMGGEDAVHIQAGFAG